MSINVKEQRQHHMMEEIRTMMLKYSSKQNPNHKYYKMRSIEEELSRMLKEYFKDDIETDVQFLVQHAWCKYQGTWLNVEYNEVDTVDTIFEKLVKGVEDYITEKTLEQL